MGIIIERVIFKDDLEKFYNHDFTLSDLVNHSWTKGSLKVVKGFTTIKIEISEMEEK